MISPLTKPDAPLPWWLHRWWLVTLLVMAPLWGLGLFTRVAWTPDEPRELALCGAMLDQAQKAVPTIAGEPFCEKPPLTYWLGAASLNLFGHSAAAARMPNLLYALIGVLAVGGLAAAMVRHIRPKDNRAIATAALVAALAAGTMQLMIQVQVWLASDAPLLMATCVALLGAWRALTATTSRARLNWWLLFHVGLILGFLAKNIVGWMVPVAAVGVYCLWDRRWRELLRWELHAGWLLHGAALGPWVVAVGAQPDGGKLLRIFFYENLVGRFLPVVTEHHYINEHVNWWGKYLVEGPGYLAPWTLLAMAAFARVTAAAWRGRDSASRFLLAAMVPVFLLLSVASTGRGIYLVIIMPAVAAALGWWVANFLTGEVSKSESLERWTVGGTLLLAALLIGLVTLVGCMLPWLMGEVTWLSSMLGALVSVGVFGWLLWRAGRCFRQDRFSAALGLAGLGLFMALVITLARVVPGFNASQDLSPTVQQIAALSKDHSLVIYRPDETILSQLDWHAGLRLLTATDTTSAADFAQRDARTLMLVKLSSDRVTAPMRCRLQKLAAFTHLRFLEPKPAAGDGLFAAELVQSGWVCWQRLEIPAGRRYGIFGRADSPLARELAGAK